MCGYVEKFNFCLVLIWRLPRSEIGPRGVGLTVGKLAKVYFE